MQNIENLMIDSHKRMSDTLIQYGTAGFRTKANELDHVMFRMGLLAALRSKATNAAIGVMVTASHNPDCDNGVKLVDPCGEMLKQTWEGHASTLANCSDVASVLQNIAKEEGVDMSQNAHVILARDTRPSSESLSAAVVDGVNALGAQLTDYGLLTTPQLHYMVRCVNTSGTYGEPTEEGYYRKLAAAFNTLYPKAKADGYSEHICVDGANGIGALKLKRLLEHIRGTIDVKIVNNGSQGRLNYMCGADFVKVQQKLPEGLTPKAGMRCCSFDGDADRIVFFYTDSSGQFTLLDGDKIATLVAGYLKDLLNTSNLDLNVGLVQTAYANGSSTRYIAETLRVPVACVPTGVKHLHHKALEFDVGVYFEANGHGTVLFSENALSKIQQARSNDSLTPEARTAIDTLSHTVDVINQTVGDAVSDLLLVELILARRGMSVQDWNAAYTDLPNRQLKVQVPDRTLIETTDAERKVTKPEGLQCQIAQLVSEVPNGRSFVRPSGTEDVVRVYAEANTQANADLLAHKVSEAVKEIFGAQK